MRVVIVLTQPAGAGWCEQYTQLPLYEAAASGLHAGIHSVAPAHKYCPADIRIVDADFGINISRCAFVTVTDVKLECNREYVRALTQPTHHSACQFVVFVRACPSPDIYVALRCS